MKAKGLLDEFGVIAKANKLLPDELCRSILRAIAELEDNEAHRTRNFPVTQLHAVEGIKGVYRAYIDKTKGWRLHVRYGEDKNLHLCDVLEPNEHDRVQVVIKKRKHRYD